MVRWVVSKSEEAMDARGRGTTPQQVNDAMDARARQPDRRLLRTNLGIGHGLARHNTSARKAM